jgi:signal transduction histidine kinase
LPLAAIILAAQERYRRGRDALIAELFNQQAVSPQGGSERMGRDNPHEKLRKIVTSTRDLLGRQTSDEKELSRTLGEILDKNIRPLTHELWAGPGRRYTDFSFLNLIQIAVSRHQHWPILTAGAVLAANGLFVIEATGWREGMARAAITATLAWLTASLLRALPTRRMVHSVVFLLAGICVFAITNEVVAGALFGPFLTLSPALSALANGVLFAGSLMVFGMLRVARNDHLGIHNELRQLQEGRYVMRSVSAEQWRNRQRDLAQLLHGRLQNHMLSLILSLTTNTARIHRDKVLADLDVIEKHLNQQDALLLKKLSGGIREQLEELANMWEGIVTVRVHVDNYLIPSSDASDAICVLAEEAITNAVRHGLASAVAIRVSHGTDHWRLEVYDNGVGPRNGRPGLGTLTAQQIAADRWSLSARTDAPGSVVHFDIPDALPS